MPDDTMERAFAKNVDSLPVVFEFVREAATGEHVDDDLTRSLQLAVEEIFVNMVKYHPESANDISIEIMRKAGRLVIRVRDHDVNSYDPTGRPPVDVTKPITDRKPGGLGVHFVRAVMDDVIYEYTDRTSTITLIKNLE